MVQLNRNKQQKKTYFNLVQNVQYSIVKLLLNKVEYKQRHDVSKSLLHKSVYILPVSAFQIMS